MGRLRITKNGIILEGPAEFVKTLKAKYVMSRGVSVFISNYQCGYIDGVTNLQCI